MTPKLLHAKISALPNTVTGAAWMIVAACFLGALSMLVRNISADLHPFEIAFFRNIAQLLLMLPWVFAAGIAVMKTQRIWAHVRRSAFGIGAMLIWFSVLTRMPIAEATAISFSAPLFTTAGAALFLREQVGVKRWMATVFGFVGVLMIIRPGFQAVGEAQLLALLAAAMIAGSMLSNKSLSRTEKPNAMVVWMGVFMSIFSLPPAVTVWQWPHGTVWLWLLSLGVVATLAHLCINRAFSAADASFIAPYGFVQIPFIAGMGYVAYGEVPDLWTWMGSGVIIASGVYIARREAKRTKSVVAPPVAGSSEVAVESGRRN